MMFKSDRMTTMTTPVSRPSQICGGGRGGGGGGFVGVFLFPSGMLTPSPVSVNRPHANITDRLASDWWVTKGHESDWWTQKGGGGWGGGRCITGEHTHHISFWVQRQTKKGDKEKKTVHKSSERKRPRYKIVQFGYTD